MSQSAPATPAPAAKKPFYKRWWFIAVVAVIALAALGKALGVKGAAPEAAGQSASAPAAAPTTEAAPAPAAAPTAEAAQDAPREHQNALAKAKTYSDSMHMSSDAIRTQLTSDAEGFTDAEADYAVAHLDD